MLGRFVVALLLAVGLLLPSMFAMNLGEHALLAVGMTLAATLVLALGDISKKMRFISLGLLGLGIGAIFITIPMNTLMSTVYAIYLKLTGQNAALPLYGQSCALLFALAFGLIGYFLSDKGAGFFPALTVSMVVLTVLWVTGRHDLIVYFLPAIAALVILYAGSVHDELPVKRVLPLALVLVLLAYLMVPAQGIVSPTLQKTAQDIRQMVFDYLFFTEPRKVFSLEAEGYYPNGISQLGGVAKPTNHPVMEVHTDATLYLRGAVKDEYTGRTWLDSKAGGRRYLYISPQHTALRASLFDMNLPKAEFAQSTLMQEKTITIKMVSDSASTVFLPQRLRGLEMLSSSMVPYFNSASEVFITRDLAQGDMYRVNAPAIMAGDAGLSTMISACRSEQDPNATGVYQHYTKLPDHLEKQVFELAQRMTAGAENPYEIALAIQTYLQHYYKYTLEPRPVQGNVDFVSYFLLKGKEGYCTYFASAMTVLCRMMDLPARYVEGYIARPNADGLAYVTGLDAHAWTEVYFEGFGWVTFDATPPRQQDNPNDNQPPPQGQEEPEPTDQPTDEPSQPPPQGENEPEPTPEIEQDQIDKLDPPIPPDEDDPNYWWLLWVTLVLAVALAALRVYFVIPSNEAKRKKTEEEVYAVWVQAVFDRVHLKKVKKLPGETLMDYAARLDRAGTTEAAITPVAQVLSHLRYSTHPVETEYVELTRDTYLEIEKRMSKWQKMKLIAYRAITPQKKADYAKRFNQ